MSRRGIGGPGRSSPAQRRSVLFVLAAHEVDVTGLLEASVLRCREIAEAGGISLSLSAEPGLQVVQIG